MRTTTQILPGIKSIAWVEAQNLVPDMALRGITQMPVPILADIHNIEFFGDPICECTTEINGGMRTETATLNFFSASHVPTNKEVAFIVTDVNGKSYVIGAKEPPYPKLKLTIHFGTPDGDRACNEYNITYSAIKTLVYCHLPFNAL